MLGLYFSEIILHFFKMKLLRCCVNTPLRCFHACMQHPNTTIRHHQTHLIKIPKVPSFQTPLPYQILFCGFQFLLPLAIWLLSYFVSINVTVSYIILFLFLSLHSTWYLLLPSTSQKIAWKYFSFNTWITLSISINTAQEIAWR